ncbi:MAG TPA: transglycosylase SLT domain-containing protein [Pusillimonas sp.]|uniref:transglycosylase SLT domain-containing protein n=1 Tax=Pusillimonas sp. TaxID=3040095 RepID=UPI002D15D96C|nr:transglycosylase SLT domain-containing protein [Pusillimonas sp.]HUH87742.1 transglycosylase SLT domain-containing protein [Pusillimonas sp.]
MNCLRIFIVLCVAALAGCASSPDSRYAANKRTYSAADTSRTVDLTHPPRDMWDRIRRGFAIPNLQSDLVDEWTAYYASHPQSVYRMSERAGKYLYYIVDQLEERGLPSELALLPFVESAYNPTAYSHAKASGLWQFIPSTGLHYNLKQDVWRDLRRDPVASTNAALDYLSYLYDFQGDWYLALASYNWGEGAVKRAIERNAGQGLRTDYIALAMPGETRNYVPKLQAIKNIIANPERYGVSLPTVENQPYFTTVVEPPSLDLATAARLAEMPLEDFKALNASFNRPVFLAEHKPSLHLPTDRVDTFNANLEAYKDQLGSYTTYAASKGESYAAIAKKFGVSLEQLRAANGLSAKQTRAVAQILVIPGGASSGGIQLASLEQSTLIDATPTVRTPAAEPGNARRDVVVVRRGASNTRTHTVRQGDTLFALAKRYNTSVDALRKLNNLPNNNLSRGKRLRIPGTNVHG